MAPPAAWEGVVTEVFRALGDCRDRTIVATTLGRALAAAGSPEPRLQPAGMQSPDPVALVRSPAFQLALIDVVAEVIVVPANSPIKTAKDLAEAVKKDVAKVTFAGGSAGGVDHIMAALVVLNLFVPRRFHWQEEMARLSHSDLETYWNGKGGS